MAQTFSYHHAFARNLGWVTPAEQSLLKEKRVAIAGLGGVGGFHLLTLARLGVGAFHIADFDTFDITNFNRQIGALAGIKMSPDGRVVNEVEWAAKKAEWLPTPDDFAFVASLMGRVIEPGKFAGWISPPVMGINRQPVDFEYVRFG